MPAPLCSLFADASADSGAAVSVGTGAGIDEGAPLPRRRGYYRGFLSPAAAADLAAGASSGASLATLEPTGHVCHCEHPNRGLALVAIALALYFGLRRRP